MNAWLVAATALLAGYLPCLWVCLRGTLADALVATQLAATVTVLALVLLAEGFGRSAYFTPAIVVAALSLVGGLVFVRLLGERRL